MLSLDNVVIEEAEQGTEEWLKPRIGLFTASHFGDLMLKQKNGQPYAKRKDYIMAVALERATGISAEDTGKSADMREGNDRERTAALAYQFATGNETEQTGFWHNDILGASCDDLIVGQDGIVEYKNPKIATHFATITSKNIPEYYYWQLLGQLLVTGRSFGDYVSYHPDFPANAQLYIKRVTREEAEADIQLLYDELLRANAEVVAIVETLKNYKG